MTIEQKIITLLGASASVPHPMPDEFITVEKTGASQTNLIPEAQIHVNCYSTSRANAAALCDSTIQTMLGAVSDADISSVTLTASYNNPDLTTEKPRYSAVFQVVYLF